MQNFSDLVKGEHF